MDIRRRQVVLGLAAGAVAGCCPTAPLIQYSGDRSRSLSALLQNRDPGSLRSSGLIPAIDAHAHFFNATDMQAGGYLVGPVANEFGVGPEFRRLLRGAAKFIDFAARLIAPNTYDEYNEIGRLDQVVAAASEAAGHTDDRSTVASRALDEAVRDFNGEHSKKIFRAMEDEGFARRVDQYAATRATRGGNAPVALSPEIIESALNGNAGDGIESYDVTNVAGFPNPFPVIEFVCQMLTFRTHSARKHQRFYGAEGETVRCVAAVGAMVDFQVFLDNCPSYSPIGDQIIVYREMNRLLGDYVLPVAPFNPALQDDAFKSQMDILESALANGDIRGVKLYPTIGYWPYGNRDLGSPGTTPVPAGQLDDALGALFELCIQHAVPVMAHAGHSMASTDEMKILGGPRGWSRAIQAFPNLKVNLGHFGGGFGEESDTSWADGFVELMRDAPGVYGDIGFWDELAEGDASRIDLIKRIVDKPLKAGDTVAERLMFGTDWMMLLLDQRWREYPDNIHDQLKSAFGDEERYYSNLFHDNAERLYSIWSP